MADQQTPSIHVPNNEDVGLSSGWARHKTPTGQPYYVDHNTQSTSWNSPRRAIMPFGWEQRQSPDGRVYFVDHIRRITSWDPPHQSTELQFFVSRDLDEGEAYFTALPNDLQSRLVQIMVSSAIRSSELEVNLVGDLFTRLLSKKLCSQDTFEEGFLYFAKNLDAIAISAPDVFQHFATMLRAAGLDYTQWLRLGSKLADMNKLLNHWKSSSPRIQSIRDDSETRHQKNKDDGSEGQQMAEEKDGQSKREERQDKADNESSREGTDGSQVHTKKDQESQDSISREQKQCQHLPSFFHRNRALILGAINVPDVHSAVTNLRGDNAQCMADFLHKVNTRYPGVILILISIETKVLADEESLSHTEKRHVLHLLAQLARSAQVFPRRCEIADVECDFSQTENEGAFGFIYKGKLRQQIVCVKAVRMYQSKDNRLNLRVSTECIFSDITFTDCRSGRCTQRTSFYLLTLHTPISFRFMAFIFPTPRLNGSVLCHHGWKMVIFRVS
jgi:hypothetical protein